MLKRRRSTRLKGHDYSSDGAYYVTICAQGQKCIFGDVVNGKMILNPMGKMIADHWQRLPERFTNVVMDEFVIMPNHMHGIIVLVGAPLVGAINDHRAGTRPAPTLDRIMAAFKSMTTVEYIRQVKSGQDPVFDQRIWQRGYYDRVIRDGAEWSRIREYIVSNPAGWEKDEYHHTV